jgi:mono/diheme cytochrome c family protein
MRIELQALRSKAMSYEVQEFKCSRVQGLSHARARDLDPSHPLRTGVGPATLTRGERKHARLAIVLLCASLTFSACSGDSDNSPKASKDPDWQRGRAIYVANCVACHNNDPAKDGPIGPALKGSPQELVKFRVLRTEYPPGYKPKRDTKVMPTFPFLETEIKYLAAYLR